MDSRSRPAEVGWALFRSSQYSLTLAQINQRLEKLGLKPISGRMYDHYGRLVRHGFEQYVTINQFDVQRLRDPVWSAAIRRRYRLREASLPAMVQLIDGEDLLQIRGSVRGLSEAMIIVETEGPLDHGLEGAHGVVRLGPNSGGHTVPVEVRLVIPDFDRGAGVLELLVLGEVDVSSVARREQLRPADGWLVIDRRNATSLAETVRTMYLGFQVVDAARMVCDAVLADIDSSGIFEIGVPEVRSLSKRNPIAVDLQAAAPLLAVLWSTVRIWNSFRTSEAAAGLTDSQSGLVSAQTEYVHERTREQRIANDVRERAAETLSPEILRAIAERQIREALGGLRSGDPLPPQPNERADALIQDELIPSMDELFASDLRAIEIETDAPVNTDDVDRFIDSSAPEGGGDNATSADT